MASQPTPSPQPAQSPNPGTSVNDLKSAMGVSGDTSSQINAEQIRRQQIQSVSMQIQDIGSRLDGIAKQFPAAAQDVNNLKQGMTKLLVRIVGSSMSESQSPTGALG
jgi:uncharacterized protein involved in exopolysaccharide biosynthesis